LKYDSGEYLSVINKNTGKKICDCSDELDALMMVSFDSQNRTIVKNKFLMSQVVDVKITKQLPTSNITVSTVKENGCTTRKDNLKNVTQPKLPQSDLQSVNL
jgi:hypothetical protein